MEMLSFGGIDVSKDRLDITVLPDEQCSSVSNDAAGWAELIEQLRGSLITAIGVGGPPVRGLPSEKNNITPPACGLYTLEGRRDANVLWAAIMSVGLFARNWRARSCVSIRIRPSFRLAVAP
jgi:hypothetical protein